MIFYKLAIFADFLEGHHVATRVVPEYADVKSPILYLEDLALASLGGGFMFGLIGGRCCVSLSII